MSSISDEPWSNAGKPGGHRGCYRSRSPEIWKERTTKDTKDTKSESGLAVALTEKCRKLVQ